MGGGNGGGGSSQEQDESAKHMFDRIGQQVHDQVKGEAAGRGGSELKGNLTDSSILGGESAYTTDPCTIVYDYYNKRDENIKRYPCGNESVSQKRFSVKQQAEYDEKKIRDNKGKGGSNEGECAPYRRLYLCDKNLETISNYDSNNARHKLLAEVCMAAYYEGDSIKTHHPPHQVTYSDSAAELCTVLARSFADIGDIIRGRDLYLGYDDEEKKQRNKLEENLQKIFKKIHDDVTNGQTLKDRYQDDTDKNYYKLREDWWTANRATVWKAITCKAKEADKYFRDACGGGKTPTEGYCRCDGDKPGHDKLNIDPPTYFDYVPQYLRWFEEWAEDFCRKKKHKLKDAIKKCREGKDQSGGERYCDLNGYDCKKTKRGRNIYRWDHKCTGCFLSCSHFRTWIDNQKEQFDKQRNKYQTEIQTYTNGTVGSGSGRQRRGARNENYDGYEKKFYDILKNSSYRGVGEFLGLLSKEKTCKDHPEVEVNGEKANSVDFTRKKIDDIFSPTEYCQACPLCGVKEQKGKWERKDNMQDCPRIKLYKPKSDEVGTPINFLYSGDRHDDIAKNLKAFCDQTNAASGGGRGDCGGNIDPSLCEKWKCYQIGELTKDDQEGVEDQYYENDVRTGGGLCI